jgi:hypothetical protein
MSMRSRSGALLYIVALVAGVSITCGDGSKPSPASPSSPVSCTSGEIRTPAFTINGTQPVGISGGSFSAKVTVTGNCRWTATTDASWVTPEAAGSAVGSGVLAYRVASNASVARLAHLTLFAGQPSSDLLIIQDGPVSAAGCAYELRPPSRSVGVGQWPFEVMVDAPYGCRWAFEGNGSWITVVPDPDGTSPWGNGPSRVYVLVEANASAGPRTGSAVIAGQTLGVTQDGMATPACQYALTPATQSIAAVGGSGSVSIATAAGCSWRITAEQGGDPWIAINEGQQGAGAAVIAYGILPNRTFAGRTASIVVTGDSGNARLVQAVTQAAATCLYTVSPSQVTHDWVGNVDGGAAFTAQVSTSPSDCVWTARPEADWLLANDGQRRGSATLSYWVKANPAGLPSRSGAIVISGLTGVNPSARLQITQSAR